MASDVQACDREAVDTSLDATGQRFKENLSALTIHQPDIARRLEHTTIPGHFVLKLGRDKSLTWFGQETDGSAGWFGGSSMPTVSAPALVEGFHYDGGSIWLASVMTGLEAQLLAGRLPPYAAVFVLERDALHLRLAMSLYDYTELLKAGRLVMFLADSVESELRQFIEANPGFEIPRQLFFSPQSTATERAELQAVVESACEAAAQVQVGFVDQCVAQLAAKKPKQISSEPRVALLSVDARPFALEQARRITNGLKHLNWGHTVCVPDSPAHCHVSARLRTVVEANADLVMFVNQGAENLIDRLPPENPVVSWFPSQANQVPAYSSHVNAFAVVESAEQIELLRAQHWPGARVIRCEPAADDVAFRPVRISPKDRADYQADIAIFADLPDHRPAAVGISLPSHIGLWNALFAVLCANADSLECRPLEPLLAQAERKSGVVLSDERLRETWLSMAKAQLVPAAVAVGVVECARRLPGPKPTIALFGQRWNSHATLEAFHRGPWPTTEARNLIYQTSGLVVFPIWSGDNVPHALDALAVGGEVVLRGQPEMFARSYPGLSEVCEFLTFFQTADRLGEIVKRKFGRTTLAESDPELKRQRAASVVRGRHTVAERMRQVVRALQGNDSGYSAG